MHVVREIIQGRNGALGGERLPDFEQGFLSKLVERCDNMPDEERVHSDYIHVSSMVGWCDRKYVLQARSKAQIPSYTARSVTGAHRIVWALGRAAEKHVRESIIRSVDFRGVFGNWKCVCEKSEHAGFYNERMTCQFCKGKLRTYHEFTLFDDDNHVCGNPDMLIVRRKRIYPVEIKSLTNSESANKMKRGFDTIIQPFGDHTFQVDAYHYMLERCFDGGPEGQDLLPGDKVMVLYVNKDFKWGSPYKEYWMRAVEPKRKQAIRREFAKARNVFNSIHGGPLPERKLCKHSTCDLAKKCPVAQECFAKK